MSKIEKLNNHPSQEVLAVGFDLDNTLFDRDSIARNVYESWAENDDVKIEEILQRDGGGHRDREKFFTWITARTGMGWADFKRDFLERLEPDLSVQKLLGWLRLSDVPFALLSNGGSFQRSKLEALGLSGLFPNERTLISSYIKADKPAVEAFLCLAKALATAPSNILYVGDQPVIDIAAASSAGFQTCWMNRAGNPSDLPCPADYTVHSIADLQCLLGGLTKKSTLI